MAYRARMRRRVAGTVLVAGCVLAACAPPGPAQDEVVRGAKGPLHVPFTSIAAIEPMVTAPNSSPPGANDYSCRPSEEHPRPVVLVHGLTQTRAFWRTASPLLKNNGYCVFAITYGQPPDAPGIGGMTSIESSAHQLVSFIDEVLEATGATEVDLVGHSEGTVMPQYYLKRLGGADRVKRYVAITPLYDGSTGWGVDRLINGLEALPHGVGQRFRDFFETACGACRDALHGSTFHQELYAEGVKAVPGVEYTTILSSIDEIVTPWQSGILDAPNATNHVLQDGCAQDRSEHLAAAVSPRAMGIMLNALDPDHAVEPPCVPTVYALGYLERPTN